MGQVKFTDGWALAYIAKLDFVRWPECIAEAVLKQFIVGRVGYQYFSPVNLVRAWYTLRRGLRLRIVIVGTFRNPRGLVCPLDAPAHPYLFNANASGMPYCGYNLTTVFPWYVLTHFYWFLDIFRSFRNYPHSTSLMLQCTSHTFNPDTQACHIVWLWVPSNNGVFLICTDAF